jgi:hypothetical protein
MKREEEVAPQEVQLDWDANNGHLKLILATAVSRVLAHKKTKGTKMALNSVVTCSHLVAILFPFVFL